MIRKNLRNFALVCSLALAGCSGGENASDSFQFDGSASPLLYEITNSDGGFEGWVLGTIHALPEGTNWRTPAIDQALDDADRLLVEVPDLSSGARIGDIFTELATTPDLGPLPARVSSDLRGPLEDMIDLSNFSPGQFEDTENWAAAIMLARVGAVGEPRNGVDRFVISQFRGRDVYGFEGAAQQLGIFDNLAEEDQRDLVEGTVREWMVSREDPGYLTRAWLSGDEDTLIAATTSGIMADTELRDALLVDRNLRWMPILISNMEASDSVLVAVGTAHIVGPDGLPAMLEARGYNVRRVQ